MLKTSLESYLDMGYKIDVSAAFITDTSDEKVLKYGTRALLWRKDDKFRSIGEGETAQEAFSNLLSENSYRFINEYQDEIEEFTIPADSPDWEIFVYSPNMGEYQNTLNRANSPDAVSSDFKIVKSKSGDCKSLECVIRNDLVKLEPRGIFQLSFKAQPAFYGTVVRNYSQRVTSHHPVHIWGSRLNLEGWMLMQQLDGQYPIEEFVKLLSEKTFKGVVTYNPDKITVPDWSIEIDGLYLLPVASILDQLVLKLPYGRWGVDATGELFIHSVPE